MILTFSEDISAVTLGSVSLDVNSTSGYEQGATVSRSGRTVTLTLLSPSLTIAAGWPVTVALSGDAVDDDAGNGNLALRSHHRDQRRRHHQRAAGLLLPHGHA